MLVLHGLHNKRCEGGLNEYEITSEAVKFLKAGLSDAQFCDLMQYGKNRYRKIRPILAKMKPELVVDVHGSYSYSETSLGFIETATKYLFEEVCSFLSSRDQNVKVKTLGPRWRWVLPNPYPENGILHAKRFLGMNDDMIDVRLILGDHKYNNPVETACYQADIPFLTLEFFWKRVQDFSGITIELLRNLERKMEKRLEEVI